MKNIIKNQAPIILGQVTSEQFTIPRKFPSSCLFNQRMPLTHKLSISPTFSFYFDNFIHSIKSLIFFKHILLSFRLIASTLRPLCE